MTDDSKTAPGATAAIPTMEDMQHWTLLMGRAQQMIMEAWADNLAKSSKLPGLGMAPPQAAAATDPMQWMTAGAEAWSKGLEAWSQMLGQYSAAGDAKDRRFGSPEWRDNPIFDTVRQGYLAVSEKLLGTVEEIEGRWTPGQARGDDKG